MIARVHQHADGRHPVNTLVGRGNGPELAEDER